MHLYSSVEQHKGLEVNLPAASEVVVVIAFIVFSVPKQLWLKLMFLQIRHSPKKRSF